MIITFEMWGQCGSSLCGWNSPRRPRFCSGCTPTKCGGWSWLQSQKKAKIMSTPNIFAGEVLPYVVDSLQEALCSTLSQRVFSFSCELALDIWADSSGSRVLRFTGSRVHAGSTATEFLVVGSHTIAKLYATWVWRGTKMSWLKSCVSLSLSLSLSLLSALSALSALCVSLFLCLSVSIKTGSIFDCYIKWHG